MAREVLSNGVINPDKYQADWYADLSNNWNLLNNLIGSAISGSEVDSKIATAVAELMVRTFQIVTELPVTGTEGVMYLVLIPNTSKYTAYVWENNAYRELGVIQMTITIDDELSTTSENPAQNKVITNALNNKAPISHTHSASDITSGLATVATSGSYNDLSNKPTIPTVNNATLTIQKNGTTVKTFTANASSNVTANITVPTKVSELTNDSGFLTGVTWNDVNNKPTFATVATSGSYNDLSNKPTIPTVNDATLTIQKNGTTIDTFTANSSTDKTVNISVPTNTSELTNGAGFITADYAVPRSGGAVFSGTDYIRTVDDSVLTFTGGTNWDRGAQLQLFGKDFSNDPGIFVLYATSDANTRSMFRGTPGGTLVWNGQPIQYGSDARLKQQINKIDTALLDAWEDVEPVQFKYNDAVKEKSDNARLHTGYVVQQIDKACQSHGVDISEYGLYCHEEYPQETEEVEVEQADGTKIKEKKVIREASEHYSLRYTEALIVECAYLRKCIKELRTEIEQLKSSK